MVIGSRFPTDKMVTAHVEAIKFGMQHDIVGPAHILFYGDEVKASHVTARAGGTIVARKNMVRSRGR